MRLEAGFAATVSAPAGAGVTVFDTARSYAGNERALAAALRGCGAAGRARIVTKGGMARPGGAWVPDGRARTLRADCEASLEALDGIPIDLYLVHAADPRTPWATTVRALARLRQEGLVERVGLSNVNRRQLDEALALAPVAAVEVALSLADDRALRGGLLERCVELDLAVIAHSPLGGPRRAAGLGRREELVALARNRGATPHEVALAWVLGLSEAVVAIPGARRPEAARSAARAGAITLDADERAKCARGARPARPPAARRPATARGEVVLVMGIPGAGKSRIATGLEHKGYLRLNRDERGGTLRELAQALDAELGGPSGRGIVLDNTWLTRAARSYAIDAAARHGAPVRCIWVQTPLAEAQVNLVLRLLARFGELPSPEQLHAAARREPGLMLPTSQMRTLRELEPPALDEGFASVECVPFVRAAHGPPERPGVIVAAAALAVAGWERTLHDTDPSAPHLVFDWRPGAGPDALDAECHRVSAVVAGPVEAAVCPHAGGPPSCWCRPPLPGLPLAFAQRHGVAIAVSTVIGTSSAHRTLASALGSRCLLLG